MALRVGLVGCGNISDIYLINAPLFRDIEFVACADLVDAAAKKQADKYGLARAAVNDLLKSDDVDIVLNLTIPEAHAEVATAAIEAGKHVYGEKPLATTLDDGAALVDLAKAKGLRVGSAPDTVLGASHQAARKLIDAGGLGRPLTGLIDFQSHGMEHWHPNPAFFFRPGAGPVFDMGPYYLSAMVTLLGPVKAVQAVAATPSRSAPSRRPTSPRRARNDGDDADDDSGLLEFANGANIAYVTSWDVWKHSVKPIEMHGEKGSLRVPDPNFFGGPVMVAHQRGDWQNSPAPGPFGVLNWPKDKPVNANYRGLGLADMARGIIDKRPHRANGDVALHVLAVMEGLLTAASEARRTVIARSCERPAALAEAEALGLLA